MLRAIVAYKQAHDGNAPALQYLADKLGQVKSSVWRVVRELENAGLSQREPSGGRSLRLGGGAWEWAEPRPYPTDRLEDVLRAVVATKPPTMGMPRATAKSPLTWGWCTRER